MRNIFNLDEVEFRDGIRNIPTEELVRLNNKGEVISIALCVSGLAGATLTGLNLDENIRNCSLDVNNEDCIQSANVDAYAGAGLSVSLIIASFIRLIKDTDIAHELFRREKRSQILERFNNK